MLTVTTTFAQRGTRSEINIPNILNYELLKCDFHMHTVFSDGVVWPVTRADEVWLEGLNAFAITDHIEYQPKEEDIPTNHNRPHEIALDRAKELGLTIIKAAEITRPDPPGHMNALFLKDIKKLDVEKWRDAVGEAINQGGIIFWNHPGWKQPDRKSVWYDEQEELYQKGWLNGVEVVNGNRYDPIAHQWCIDKNLTMYSNSDVHAPTNLNYDFANGAHRPMTLVLAKSNSAEDIKEALKEHRTVLYWENNLIGDEKFLKPIFEKSVLIKNAEFDIAGDETVIVQILNRSDISFEMELVNGNQQISVPEKITLYADKTVQFRVRKAAKELSGSKEYALPYIVKNLMVAPEQGLSVELKLNINFKPDPE